jgi:hypothetical protein
VRSVSSLCAAGVNGTIFSDIEKRSDMSVHTRLAALEERHQALERKIDAELKHPSCDDLKVGELKRCKLVVKDEIASVGQSVYAVTSRVRSARTKKRAAACRMAKRKSNGWYQHATQSISIKNKLP